MAIKPGSKREKFITEYLVDRNATQAAIRAGFSKKTAGSAGERLLKNVDISSEIKRLTVEQTKRTLVTADNVIRELAYIAFSDIRKAYTETGELKDVKKIPLGTARAIAGLEVDELFEGVGRERIQIGVTKTIKLWSKPDALVALGKHLGLFKEIHEVTFTNMADKVKAARMRAKNAATNR